MFDPRTRRLQVVGGHHGDLGTTRSFQTVTALDDGQVLVAGGYDRAIVPTARAWLLDVPDRSRPPSGRLTAVTTR